MTDKFDTKSFNSVSLVNPIFHLTTVSEHTVRNVLNNLKNLYAEDKDSLDCSFLKSNADVLLTPIIHVVNISIRQSIFPNS